MSPPEGRRHKYLDWLIDLQCPLYNIKYNKGMKQKLKLKVITVYVMYIDCLYPCRGINCKPLYWLTLAGCFFLGLMSSSLRSEMSESSTTGRFFAFFAGAAFFSFGSVTSLSIYHKCSLACLNVVTDASCIIWAKVFGSEPRIESGATKMQGEHLKHCASIHHVAGGNKVWDKYLLQRNLIKAVGTH